ncbi:unnamed protein product [Chondrus crispus]|uniref:Uncharacterized protein n=1 Tax=Chondrus crispus TaxID=2769 RepID=R7QFF6_CHOCR|nr:unnamed protein product [Chondrus crispus]CDF36819.1 unnamed protein product [Chondrus crispus]|eukprot:XP_005716638.1 unnamed protein product [Chondrus crispus]
MKQGTKHLAGLAANHRYNYRNDHIRLGLRRAVHEKGRNKTNNHRQQKAQRTALMLSIFPLLAVLLAAAATPAAACYCIPPAHSLISLFLSLVDRRRRGDLVSILRKLFYHVRHLPQQLIRV